MTRARSEPTVSGNEPCVAARVGFGWSAVHRPPFDTAIRERSFGLVRADGTEKPAADVVRAFAARLERGQVKFGVAPKVLDVTSTTTTERPTATFGGSTNAGRSRRLDPRPETLSVVALSLAP